MESLALYLIKSAIWLTGFALVFILFLRNERFFFLNRFYLITGIIASFILPFITIRYIVYVPVMMAATEASAGMAAAITPERGLFSVMSRILLIIYVSGALIVALLIIRQCRSLIKSVRNAEVHPHHQVKLIRTADIKSSFSFFSFVFVNPSVTDIEAKEILNHELVHVRQKHWFDLLLAEMLCMIQWFNPMIWIYVRYIRQNHEYLADEVALQRSSDPAVYRAVLLNQIVGAPVVVLANSFNYSINLKRFKMMKNKITSPYRKMKVLLILPVIAIVLYSFAKPDYKFISVNDNPANEVLVSVIQSKEVKGVVLREDGKPLAGANVVVLGTTNGGITDLNGMFRLTNLSDNDKLMASYMGYQAKVVKSDFKSEMTISLIRKMVAVDEVTINPPPPPPLPPPPTPASAGQKSTGSFVPPPPPPPPPPPSSGQKSKVAFRQVSGSDTIRVAGYYLDPEALPKQSEGIAIRGIEGKPLVVVDGLIYNDGINTINPMSIESITVMKDFKATDKYGDKAKDGVIEITTKKHYSPAAPGSGQSTDEVTVTGYGQKSINSLNEVIVKGYQSPESFPGNPLVVIDGVIVGNDADSLPKADMINNISVLKDASATKLYGEKGKNGVIIITTKKPVKK